MHVLWRVPIHKKILNMVQGDNTPNIQGKILRIGTGSWTVNCSALFDEACTKCSLENHYSLDIIK